MEYVYAALLLHSTKQEINEIHVKKVVEAAGGKADDAQVKALVASLNGVNIEEAISKAAVAPVAAAPASAAVETKKEEKKSEKSDEEKSAEAAGGLAALFG